MVVVYEVQGEVPDEEESTAIVAVYEVPGEEEEEQSAAALDDIP